MNIDDLTVESWEHAGFKCRIVYDDQPADSPRDNTDSPSTLVTSGDAGFGDETFDPDYLDRTIDCPTCDGAGEIENPNFDPEAREGDAESSTVETAMIDCPNEHCDNGTIYLDTLADKLRHDIGGGCVLVPLRFEDYGSSGSRLYEADDDRFNAYIYVEAETVFAEWGGAIARMANGETLQPGEGGYVDPDTNEFQPASWWARRYLLGEVEELDEWLRGEVYGWVVGDEDEPHRESCWGFYGMGRGPGNNRDYMRSLANEAAEGLREEDTKEANEAAEWAARGVVTR